MNESNPWCILCFEGVTPRFTLVFGYCFAFFVVVCGHLRSRATRMRPRCEDLCVLNGETSVRQSDADRSRFHAEDPRRQESNTEAEPGRIIYWAPQCKCESEHRESVDGQGRRGQRSRLQTVQLPVIGYRFVFFTSHHTHIHS
jgi:hypothetical protein